MMFIRNEKFPDFMRLYPVVSILILMNILVFLLRYIPVIGDLVIVYGIGSNYFLANGEWWRMLTPMFLHADFMHLLMNMFSLFIFGPDLERLLGKMRFITVYLFSGIAGILLTFGYYDLNYNPYLGASGAIFGIFGAFGALVTYMKNKAPQLKQVILPIIGISVVLTFFGSNINITGHIGGLIGGYLFGLYYFHPKRVNRFRK